MFLKRNNLIAKNQLKQMISKLNPNDPADSIQIASLENDLDTMDAITKN